MKIGLFTDTYYPDTSGVAPSLENLSAALRRKGHTVYIFAPRVRGYEDKDKDVFRLPSVKVLSSEPVVRFPVLIPNQTFQKMFRLDMDLVHAHGNGAFSLLGYQIARLKNIPYILTFHSIHTKYTHYVFNGRLIKPEMAATGLRLFANLCDGVLVPSEKMAQELRNYGFKGKIKVIPGFINLEKFARAKEGYLHRKLKLPPGAPIILSVGRVGKEKNFDFLIGAFQRLAKINQAAHLVIVGQGPEKNNLNDLARKLGVSQKVHLVGKIDSRAMPRVYADATAFAFSSTTETQGICVLEAAAAGLPLVVVEDTAFKGVVVDGGNGFSVPENKEIFADRLALLLNDQVLREKFGKESEKLASQNFSPEKLAAEMLKFYQEIRRKHKTKKRILRRIINKASFINFIRIAERFNKLIGTAG